jgi:hypothetical protein
MATALNRLSRKNLLAGESQSSHRQASHSTDRHPFALPAGTSVGDIIKATTAAPRAITTQKVVRLLTSFVMLTSQRHAAL